jgi:hypothetical protein
MPNQKRRILRDHGLRGAPPGGRCSIDSGGFPCVPQTGSHCQNPVQDKTGSLFLSLTGKLWKKEKASPSRQLQDFFRVPSKNLLLLFLGNVQF